jgi:hypothetical protein
MKCHRYSRTLQKALVLNWLLARIEADKTGSVGVRQAAMTSAVAISTLNIKAAKREQMNQENVMTMAICKSQPRHST